MQDAGPSTPPSTPPPQSAAYAANGPTSRARELTIELKRLQESVEALDANVLESNIEQVRELVLRGLQVI